MMSIRFLQAIQAQGFWKKNTQPPFVPWCFFPRDPEVDHTEYTEWDSVYAIDGAQLFEANDQTPP